MTCRWSPWDWGRKNTYTQVQRDVLAVVRYMGFVCVWGGYHGEFSLFGRRPLRVKTVDRRGGKASWIEISRNTRKFQ